MQQSNCFDLLSAARSIADFASAEGVLSYQGIQRPVYSHMGALLADCVLQAGLNYTTVVRPRIASILATFPHATTIKVLVKVIEEEGSPRFLQWEHREKVSRFDNLLAFVAEAEIQTTAELRFALEESGFRKDIRNLRGVGPKTVDYMACLVGADRIAVDRHIKSFASIAGLENDGYDYLQQAFAYAADLLDISRREFDSRIWSYQSVRSDKQLKFQFEDEWHG